MTESNGLMKKIAALGIFFLCFGYFASYVPYSMWVKMITRGLFEGMDGNGFDGMIIQPVVVFGNIVAMVTCLSLLGWWKYAKQFKIGNLSLPRPRWTTFFSGICTGGIIITTTLAYTFEGISIVFAMLLMRGGVLAAGPIIDTIAIRRKRKIYWPSWVASLLSFVALFIGISSKTSTAMTFVAISDISLYLLSYFIRLYIMSNYAKSQDDDERRGYVAEEQIVANGLLFLALAVIALFGRNMDPGSVPGLLYSGFVVYPFQGFFWISIFIGVFSYGTGIFGGLILLDKRENTFTIPANRSASIIAGILATYLLAFSYHQKFPRHEELIGVGLILAAIFFLSYRTIAEKKKKVTGTVPTPSMGRERGAGIVGGSLSGTSGMQPIQAKPVR